MGGEKDPSLSSLSTRREETRPTGNLVRAGAAWLLGWAFSPPVCKSLGIRVLSLSFLWSHFLLDGWT